MTASYPAPPGVWADDLTAWRIALRGVSNEANKLVVFDEIAESAAQRVIEHEIGVADAADVLHELAESTGILEILGEDRLQERLSQAFKRIEHEIEHVPDLEVGWQNANGGSVGPDELMETVRPPAFSDEALALRFSERHADDLRYVAAWGRWLRWDGTCWRFDDSLHAFDLARRICREAAAECNQPKVAVAIASAKTVAAVERLAKADRRHAATVDQWDADPLLLNTPAGVVDLRNGRMRPHRAADYLTKITGIAPDALCPTPNWTKFLNRVLSSDTELTAYMQRLIGYALTGLTREHVLAFLYGTGANGKSTFITAITGCAGDYHRSAPIETFTVSHGERHPTELAGLRGARLVTAVETEEGRRWAESRIKALTGGDKIAARFMRSCRY